MESLILEATAEDRGPTQEGDKQQQLVLDFGDEHEKRQLDAEKKHWNRRLAELPREQETEPSANSRTLRGEGPAHRAGGPRLSLAHQRMSDTHLIRAHQAWLGFLQQLGLVVRPARSGGRAGHSRNERDRQPTQARRCPAPGRRARTRGFCRLPKVRDRLPRLGRSTALVYPDRTCRIPSTSSSPTSTRRCDPPTPSETQSRPTRARGCFSYRGAPDVDLDKPRECAGRKQWHASPQARFERLLRETGVPIGLLSNGTHPAPRLRPAGRVHRPPDVPGGRYAGTSGRPIVAALHMLLSAASASSPAPSPRSSACPPSSGQPQVPERRLDELAEQVLDALWELLRGFQAANEATKGELLQEILEKDPQDVYGGSPRHAHAARLRPLRRGPRTDASRTRSTRRTTPSAASSSACATTHAAYPDTMDQRYGAWAQLLTLFRLIHDGGAHGDFKLPPRHGRLFNPDTWDFLEGRPYGDELDRRKVHRAAAGAGRRRLPRPREPDLSSTASASATARSTSEQIGSVYEAMMGFELREAEGPSIA